MKSKLKKIVILLILGLVFPIILNNNFNLSNDLPHKVDIPRTSATVDYIIIDALATTNTTSYGNWSWARAQPWCTTGDGTKEYPYIIEDVTIIYPPAIDCLTVRNSRKYFIVRNCTLKDIPVSTFAGIRLNNVTNANIIDNIAYNNTYGIYLVNCYNSTISGNTANNNSLGIYLYFSDNNTVSGNTANDNNDGIYLEESYGNTISGNTANGNSQNGLYSYFCDYNTIAGNTANNNDDNGIYIDDDCDNNTISGNIVCNNETSSQNTGIRLDNCNNNTISGNTANENSHDGIYLYDHCDNNTLYNNTANGNNYGIFLEDYCDNNNISGNTLCNNTFDGIYLYFYCDNNTISGNTVCNNTGGDGIYLYFYCDNNTISGNTANYNYYGIYLEEDCTNNTISGNTANDNINSGIYVYDNCINNTLYNNTANNNADNGIHLEYNSDNNIISGNTVNDNVLYIDNSDYNIIAGNTVNNHTGDPGIYLFNSDYNTVSGNTANYNGEAIDLQNSHYNNITGNTANNNTYGIYLYTCENNTISGNTVNNNTQHGIFLSHCLNNLIAGNNIIDNLDNGIRLFGDEDPSDYNNISDNIIYRNLVGLYFDFDCKNNKIINNVIYKNNFGINLDHQYGKYNLFSENFFLENGIHAVDDGTDNKWNSTAIGNYWDNHTGPDLNDDGIVDTQYNISGTPGGIDYLPIAEDGAPSITINSPNDDDLIGSNPPSYDVTITDNSLVEMWYSLDGGLHNYTFTEFTGTIDQSAWESLSEGPNILTFYASDILGNIGSTYVNIIKDTTSPIILIVSPVDDEEYGTQAPLFNITITDDHLDSIWYSLDGGLTTHAITTNATIDQTAWAALSDGLITITFYANDTLGNEASEDVIITKSIPSSPPDDPTMVIVIVVVSIVGGVAVLAGLYIFMKKRASP